MLLLAYKASNRRNYAKEAFLTLYNMLTLSQRLKEQLLWSRTVNTGGGAGRNIPCDLALEHLNRRLKTVLSNVGANITPTVIVRAAKSIGLVNEVCHTFEESVDSSFNSGRHSVAEDQEDLDAVLKILQENRIMQYCEGRRHSAFEKPWNISATIASSELHKWLKKLLKECNVGTVYSDCDIETWHCIQ